MKTKTRAKQDGLESIALKELGKRVETAFAAAADMLDKAYKLCDTEGHQDVKGNRCGYCHRHLEYSADGVDEIRKSRRNMSAYQKPLDAPALHRQAVDEIGHKKLQDYVSGLDTMMTKIKKR